MMSSRSSFSNAARIVRAVFAASAILRRDRVAVGHDDDHGFGFAVRDQAVEDPVCFAVDAPSGVVVAEPMHEVKHRVFRRGIALVAGRGIDVQTALDVERFRKVVVPVHRAVRDVGAKIPRRGRVGRDLQDARPRGALRLDRRIAGIDGLHAIDREGVLPDARRDRTHGRRPQAVFVLGQLRFGHGLPGHAHFPGLGRLEPEGSHGAIIRRDLRLTGKGGGFAGAFSVQRQECDQGKKRTKRSEFHGGEGMRL